MERSFTKVVIYNENKLNEYIDATSAMSEKNKRETTTLEEIKSQILEWANDPEDCCTEFGIECMKGGDRVHLFVTMAEFKSELSVSYMGTTK